MTIFCRRPFSWQTFSTPVAPDLVPSQAPSKRLERAADGRKRLIRTTPPAIGRSRPISAEDLLFPLRLYRFFRDLSAVLMGRGKVGTSNNLDI